MSADRPPRFGPAWLLLVVLVLALAAGWGIGHLLPGRDRGPVIPLRAARPLLGTVVDITCRRRDGSDEETRRLNAAMVAAFTEIARIDSLFGRQLPPPISMTPPQRRRERLEVLDEGLAVMRLTDGAFDPRLARLLDLWGFPAGTPLVPAADAIDDEVARLQALGSPPDADALLAVPELLDFGAWAKGYAVDRALAVLRDHGVRTAMVDAGGEVGCLGDGWTVGVQHPRQSQALLARVVPGRLAVATSGDYQQCFEQDGEHHHHLLDPRTGWPARSCRSVTVLASTCERADALATGIFILGPERGLALAESLDGVACLIIDADGGRHESSRLRAYLLPD